MCACSVLRMSSQTTTSWTPRILVKRWKKPISSSPSHFGRIFAFSFAHRLRKFSQDVFIYPGEIYLSSLNPKVLRGEIGGQWAWHNWAAENICSLTYFGILHPSSAAPKTSMYFASPVGNYLKRQQYLPLSSLLMESSQKLLCKLEKSLLRVKGLWHFYREPKCQYSTVIDVYMP